MAGIIRDMLQGGRSGRETLGDLLEEAVSAFAPRADATGVTVTCDLADGSDGPADARLFQVFCNIIKNALDAMPSGGVLTIHGTDRGAVHGGVRRHRLRADRRTGRAGLRAVLHHQTRRGGHGAGLGDLPRDCPRWAARSPPLPGRRRGRPSRSYCRSLAPRTHRNPAAPARRKEVERWWRQATNPVQRRHPHPAGGRRSDHPRQPGELPPPGRLRRHHRHQRRPGHALSPGRSVRPGHHRHLHARRGRDGAAADTSRRTSRR